MGETGFCKNLRFSAVSCENLRFPAVFCANLRLPNPLIYRASRKSAKICKNLRKCAFRVRFLPFAVSLNESCQMGGREVAGRSNGFFLQESERSRSYRVTNQHPNLPWNFVTHVILSPPHFLLENCNLSPRWSEHASWKLQSRLKNKYLQPRLKNTILTF